MRAILIEDHKIDLKVCAYGFPWHSDVPCYNFRHPEELVLTDCINNFEDAEEVETLVIGCKLDYYDFIREMVNLRQLYIYNGAGIKNLSFVRNQMKLQQLLVYNSEIDNLDSLIELIDQKEKMWHATSEIMAKIGYGMEGICIQSKVSALDESPLLKRRRIYVSEIIINGKQLKE